MNKQDQPIEQNSTQQFNPIVTSAALPLQLDKAHKSKQGIKIKDLSIGKPLAVPAHDSVFTRDLLQTVNHYLLHNRFELKQKKTCHTTAPLVVFLIDSSSSMAVNKMIAYVKGLVENTAKKHARQSVKYALVALIEGKAEVIFPPGKSTEQLYKAIENLKTGGQTDMASGIRKVHEVIKKHTDNATVKLFILTDGKINKGKTTAPFDEAVQVHRQLLGSIRSVTVIDTESGFVKLQMAKDFANGINATYKKLEI